VAADDNEIPLTRGRSLSCDYTKSWNINSASALLNMVKGQKALIKEERRERVISLDAGKPCFL
jgi:hypothetical protein